jgi:hypothetical protein
MRSASLLLFLTATLAMGQSVAEKEEGFVPLFDGKSFAGWKTNANTAKSWKVDNGMMVLLGGSNSIYTEKKYADFVLRLEWRAQKKGYNSGLFLRGNNQINLAQKAVGQLIGNKGTKPVPEMHNEPGQWNEWEVTCVGPKVTFKVNGKLAWSIDDFKATEGPIGLQAEGQPIDFKNLRIKEIKR